LHDVLSIGAGGAPAAGEKKEGRAQLGKTGFPIFIDACALHDLFTVFYV
jgi:hypothetical protein